MYFLQCSHSASAVVVSFVSQLLGYNTVRYTDGTEYGGGTSNDRIGCMQDSELERKERWSSTEGDDDEGLGTGRSTSSAWPTAASTAGHWL